MTTISKRVFYLFFLILIPFNGRSQIRIDGYYTGMRVDSLPELAGNSVVIDIDSSARLKMFTFSDTYSSSIDVFFFDSVAYEIVFSDPEKVLIDGVKSKYGKGDQNKKKKKNIDGSYNEDEVTAWKVGGVVALYSDHIWRYPTFGYLSKLDISDLSIKIKAERYEKLIKNEKYNSDLNQVIRR